MYKTKCKLCDQIFEHHLKGKELWNLNIHLKKVHSITSYEYVKNTEYSGENPLCKCGCGNHVKFYKWKFNTYFEDHKNFQKVSKSVLEKISNTVEKNSKYKYVNLGLSYNDLVEYWNKYKTPEFTKKTIENICQVDFRTIEKYWQLNEIANNNEIRRYKKLHQHVWANIKEKNGVFVSIDDNLLDEMIDYAWKRKRSKKHITINQLKEKFKLDYTVYIIQKRLIDRFGEDCLHIFSSGLASKPELEFKTILEFYFGQKNVIHTFRLERKFYDFLLFDKLLIEYDGDYWHSFEKQTNADFNKNEIAEKYKYKIYRIKDSESKKPEHILEIKKILNTL